MYLHISPKFINQSKTPVILNKFIIKINNETFTLNKDDLKVFSPFSNKQFLVACKKQRKNTIGLLFKSQEDVLNLTTTAIWQNLANVTNFKHIIDYQVICQSTKNPGNTLISTEVPLWLEYSAYHCKVPSTIQNYLTFPKTGLTSVYYLMSMSDNLNNIINEHSKCSISGNTVEVRESYNIPMLEPLRLQDYKSSNIDILLYKVRYLQKLPELDKAITL